METATLTLEILRDLLHTILPKNMYIYIYVLYIYMYNIYIYIYIYIYMYTHVRTYLYMCVYMYIHMVDKFTQDLDHRQQESQNSASADVSKSSQAMQILPRGLQQTKSERSSASRIWGSAWMLGGLSKSAS